ncbi:hypothetical protein LZ32DRAFT_240656 [Colletotrichum eremochloae]|nr:hypothetical protein LZ32DRAFT_240656 [Colletotrichum eremochloae]
MLQASLYEVWQSKPRPFAIHEPIPRLSHALPRVNPCHDASTGGWPPQCLGLSRPTYSFHFLLRNASWDIKHKRPSFFFFFWVLLVSLVAYSHLGTQMCVRPASTRKTPYLMGCYNYFRTLRCSENSASG